MLKLLICLASALLIALATLHLRQQNLEANYEAAELHAQIEAQQARLWNQQLQIANYTSPQAITQNLAQLDLKLSPKRPANLPANVNPAQPPAPDESSNAE